MRTQMPFDTEKERKTIKNFSYRQVAYMVVGLLLFIQLVQVVYKENMGILGFIFVVILLLPVTAPFLYFAFKKNAQTGYFMDRHMFYYIRHNSTQSGVWRRN